MRSAPVAWQRIRTTLAGAVICALAVACGDREATGGGAGTVDRPAVPEAERYGGTVVMAGRNDIVSMMSLATSDDLSIQHQVHLLFVTLVRNGADLEPEPYLAESWEFSKDSLAVTVQLRDDLVWHDGEPVTARDVLALNRVLDRAVTHASVGHTDALFFEFFEGEAGRSLLGDGDVEDEARAQLAEIRREVALVVERGDASAEGLGD